MPTSTEIKRYTKKLETKCKRLKEKAYDFKFVDNALSAIAQYKSMRLQQKINRINLAANHKVIVLKSKFSHTIFKKLLPNNFMQFLKIIKRF